MANTVTITIDGDSVKAVSAISQVETKLDHMDKKAKTASNNSAGSFGMIDQALGKMGINLGSLTAGFAVGAVVTGLGAMMKSAIDTADSFADMSKRTGVSVENLSTLSFAASQNGTTIESLDVSLKKLSTSMLGISEDGENAKNTLNKLGIQATDESGKLRSVDKVLLDVSDKFQAMPDGARKSALAVELFGKKGAELIPLLNNGSEGIKQFQEEAKRLGLEIDSTTAIMADQFNDQLDVLHRQVSAIGMSMASELLPSLIAVSGGMIEFMTQSGAAEVIGKALSYVIKGVATAFVFLVEGITAGVNILGMFGAVVAKALTGDWDQIGTVIEISMNNIKSSAVNANDTLKKIWGDAPVDTVNPLINQTESNLNRLGGTAKKTEDNFAKYYLEIQNLIKPLSPLEKKLQDAGIAFEKMWDSAKNDEQRGLALDTYNQIKDKILGKEFPISTAITNDLTNLRTQLEGFNKIEFSPVNLDVKPMEDYGLTWMLTGEQMVQGAATTFGMMADAAQAFYQQGGERSKTMLALYKASAITQTAITTIQAATAALAPWPMGLGPIFGIPLMATTIALGVANIARISSMQVGSGLSGGASGSVPSIPSTGNSVTNNTNTRRTQELTINVYGNIVDNDKFARELIPALQKAYGDGV